MTWLSDNLWSTDRRRKSKIRNVSSFSILLMRRLVLRRAYFLRQTTPFTQPFRPVCPISRSLPSTYTHFPPFRRCCSQRSSERTKACPSCGSPLDMIEISCKTCNALSPLPENVNYLSLFGFPSTQYDIDLRKLRTEYLKLMSKVHPDSVIDKSEVRTSHINTQITNFRIKNE